MIIPLQTIYEVKRGHKGVVVWAVQRGLNDLNNVNLLEDGVFGKETQKAVIAFQGSANLFVDGVFGDQSSYELARRLESQVTADLIPPGLLRGIVHGESSSKIGAVNWSTPGGVDCSYVQRRVLEPNYENVDIVHSAFSSKEQFSLVVNKLKGKHDLFMTRANVNNNTELAWRLAALDHNYPYAAETISNVGTDNLTASEWKVPVNWVVDIHAFFDDGEPVTTELEWCRYYALGALKHNHPGAVTRYVTNWS